MPGVGRVGACFTGRLIQLDPSTQEVGDLRSPLTHLLESVEDGIERAPFTYVLRERGSEDVLEHVPALGSDQPLGGGAEVDRGLGEEGAVELDSLLDATVMVDGVGEALGIAALGHDELASTAAGMGVQLVSVCQDIAQVQARFGRRAGTIVNNHRAKLAGRGISDIETLNYFTHLIGSASSNSAPSAPRAAGRDDRRRSEGDTYREPAPGHVLRQSKEASVVMVYGSLAPTTRELRPWYAGRRLVRLQKDREAPRPWLDNSRPAPSR